MAKERMNINDVLGGEVEPPVTTFKEADARAKEEKIPTIDKGGRPIKGKSAVSHDIRFKVDDETYEWLMKQTVKADGYPARERTAHAVVKKITMAQFNISNP